MRFIRTAAMLAAGLVIGASAVAIAGSTGQQYAGCLAKDGTLYRVAVGSEPLKECAKTDTAITWNQQGDPGTDGVTPHIGANGDWYIGDTDTTVAAQGPAGAPGTNGIDGTPGTLLTAIPDGTTVSRQTSAAIVGLGCGPTGDGTTGPQINWEGGGALSIYIEEFDGNGGVTVTHETGSANRVGLGATLPKATIVFWDPTYTTVPAMQFTLWATDCTDMVYSQSPAPSTAV